MQWVLVALGVGLAGILAVTYPSLRRYLRIKRM